MKTNRDRFQLCWRLLFVLPVLVTIQSCDMKDFGDMNVSPTSNPELDPGMQFTYLQLNLPGNALANLHHAGPFVQAVTRANSPGNYYMFNQAQHEAFFNGTYGAPLRNLMDLLHRLEELQAEGEKVDNLLASVRILRVYRFHRATDLYGDIPYFEAGKGLYDLNFTPKYDPQSEIYLDMLNELAEAVELFDDSQPTFGSQDIFWGGNVEKWRKFGNSLRLRLALRLVKISPEKAKEEAISALNAPGGVMESDEDMAYFKRPGEPFRNEHSLRQEDIGVWMLTQTLVEWLKDHNDPRLQVYAAIMDVEQVSTIHAAFDHVVSTDPSDQLGFPSGYGNQESVTWGFSEFNIDQHPSWAQAAVNTPTPDTPMNGYSKVNPVLWTLHAPSIFQTYAEVALMRAEVAARGWTNEDPEYYYNEGVRSAMSFISVYNNGIGTTISDSEIDAYLTANPFDPDRGIEQINEQYWAAAFGSMDFVEAWSNFRRSGYPDLEPAMVDSNEWPSTQSTGNKWPRRLLYPINEQNQNRENYYEALSRQGLQGLASDMAVPVWWDAE